MKSIFSLILTLALAFGGVSALQAQSSPMPMTNDITVPAAPVVNDPLLVPAPQPQLMDLIPTYPVENMAKALDFYQNKLGFTVVLRAGSNYSAVGRDLIQIGLAQFKGAAKGPKSSSYINMNNIDVFYKELIARGVKMAHEIKTQPSKMREFAVIDPDGNTLTFGEYMGPK